MGRCRPARDGKAKFPRSGEMAGVLVGSAADIMKVIVVVVEY